MVLLELFVGIDVPQALDELLELGIADLRVQQGVQNGESPLAGRRGAANLFQVIDLYTRHRIRHAVLVLVVTARGFFGFFVLFIEFIRARHFSQRIVAQREDRNVRRPV